ncbi:MAG: hypothetical protein ABEK50_14970 [bacterium]
MTARDTTSGASVLLVSVLLLLVVSPVCAGVSVLPLNRSDTVVTTVYESGDLAMAEEHRDIVLDRGVTKLRFSWGNRTVDPSSLDLSFEGTSDKFHLKETSYPSERQNTVIWTLKVQEPTRTTAVITYLFAGLTADPHYNFVVNQRADTARLSGRFKFRNRTGNEIKTDRVRVLLGEVNLLTSISDHGRQWQPKEPPHGKKHQRAQSDKSDRVEEAMALMRSRPDRTTASARVSTDYHLLEMDNSIRVPPNTMTFVPFVVRKNVGVSERYEVRLTENQSSLTKTLTIPNTPENQLGTTVLPAGTVNLMSKVGRGGPSWESKTTLEYAAPSDSAEVRVDSPDDVRVERSFVDHRRLNFQFDEDRVLRGWQELTTERVYVKNYRSVPISVTVKRAFGQPYWTMVDSTVPSRKAGSNQVQFELKTDPVTSTRLDFTYRMPRGSLR